MESSDKKLPKIKILACQQNDDKFDVEFEVDDEFLDYAKFELDKQEITQEELGQYVKDIISKSLNKEDGYEIKQNFIKNTKTTIDN